MTHRSTRFLILMGSALALSMSCSGGDAAGLDDNEVSDADTGDAAEEVDTTEDTADSEEDTEDGSGDADVEPDTAPDVDASGCPPDMCEIDGKCLENGTPNPNNPCEVCLVPAKPVGWSFDDTAACDDGDPCTLEDTCFQGACIGTVDACDDGNPCTAGVCDPLTGECSYVARSGPCTDGDPCTVGDYCTGGMCVSGSARLACDDGNQCTTDRCEAGVGCVSTPLTGRDCDDGSACTAGDICQAGVCVGGEVPVDCDDGNLCTVNWCDPELGCRSRSIANLCETNNPCATATCDPDQGCVYIPKDIPCDDGTSCTLNDWCVEGVCRGTPLPIDDDNPCTDDMCIDGDVLNVPHTRSCDDGDVCTIGDVCTDGGCVSGTTLRNCDDNNPCTDDYCDPVEGCVNVPNTIPCDDGDICTWGDTCTLGECVAYDTLCPSNNPCLASYCSPISGECVSEIIDTLECRPTITITYPPRGVTIMDDGSGTVVVQGKATSGAGPNLMVVINGNMISPDANGNFSVPLSPGHGGTILVAKVIDEIGVEAQASQSFLFSDAYVLPNAAGTQGHMTEGMGVYLGNEALRTLGNIMSLALDNYDLSGMLPDPIAREAGHTIRPQYPDPIIVGHAVANLTAGNPTLGGYPGRIHLRATLPDIRVNLRISGPLCSGEVTYTASSLVVDADMHLRVVGNSLDSVLNGVNAKINSGDLDVDCSIPGIGSLIELVVGDISGEFEEQIEDALGGEIGPLIADAFDAFAFDFELDLPSLDPTADPVALVMETDFLRVASDGDGLNLVQRTMVKTEHVVPHVNLGIPMRRNCGLANHQVKFREEAALELILSDDSINQLLHGAWRAGMFEFDVPPELLGDVDLSQYGVTDLSLHASGMLAPTVSDCSIPGQYLLHIGDLSIDASMGLLGTPLDAMLYLSLYAVLEITAADGELGLGIAGIERVEIQVVVEDPELHALGSVLEDLVADQLVPSLLDALGGDALGTFPLPEVDISESIDGVPPGTKLLIEPSAVNRLDGNNVIGASLEMVVP